MVPLRAIRLLPRERVCAATDSLAPSQPVDVMGHRGNQKWRGRRITLGGSSPVTFLCQWKDRGLIFALQAFWVYHFTPSSLWEQTALNVFLHPGEDWDQGIAQKCGFLYYSVHYLFPKRICLFFSHFKELHISYVSQYEKQGRLREWRSYECSFKKIFPKHIEEDLEFVIIPFHRSIYRSKIAQWQLISFFFN